MSVLISSKLAVNRRPRRAARPVLSISPETSLPICEGRRVSDIVQTPHAPSTAFSLRTDFGMELGRSDAAYATAAPQHRGRERLSETWS